MLGARPERPDFPPRVQALLRALNATILPKAAKEPARHDRPPPSQRATYSEAARRGAATSHPARAARPPVSNTRQEPARPRRSPAAPPRDTTASPHRLVLRWPPKSKPCVHAPPADITSSLNSVLSAGGSPCIRGVNWSRSGNLIIHVQPPFTSSQIQSMVPFKRTVASALNHKVHPTVDESGHWHGVVVNGVPGPEFWQAYQSHGDQLGTALLEVEGLDSTELKRMTVLCKEDEAGTKATYSVRFMLGAASMAKRLRRDGLFVLGTHCRVSGYHPRHGGRGGTNSSLPDPSSR